MDLNCCLFTDDGGYTWNLQSSIAMVGAKLFGVNFRDENLGSICGARWSLFFNKMVAPQAGPWAYRCLYVNLNDIFNFGLLTGCIVGDQGTVLYTVNNWYQYIEQTPIHLKT